MYITSVSEQQLLKIDIIGIAAWQKPLKKIFSHAITTISKEDYGTI